MKRFKRLPPAIYVGEAFQQTMEVQERICHVMESDALTYEDMADTLGVKVPEIQRMLQSDNLSFKDAIRLASSVGLRFDARVVKSAKRRKG